LRKSIIGSMAVDRGKQGIFSNKVMLVWAGVAIAFLVFVTNVLAVQVVFKVMALGWREWGIAFAVPFVAIFW
jgi:hypothetical protein